MPILKQCECCGKEPITHLILDTYSVPKYMQLKMYLGIECLKKMMKYASYYRFKYAGWYYIFCYVKAQFDTPPSMKFIDYAEMYELEPLSLK